MRYRQLVFSIFSSFNVIVFASSLGLAMDPPLILEEKNKSSVPRQMVFVSDLHFGVGKTADNSWDPTEDFRWSAHLAGFLDEVGSWGSDRVDLVIVGDLLELWQPPTGLQCKSENSDQGCTITEIGRIAELVAKAHGDDLKLLTKFALRGDNRLFVIPGNHDAALIVETVWNVVRKEMGTVDDARVILVKDGVWVSDDGLVVAEHGHQIGADVNQFRDWPVITTGSDSGETFLVRPWGERFVQKLYNAKEAEHPVIDNLSPESAGVRYYMAEKGFWGSVADVGRFLKFNIFETSLSQKGQALGPKAPKGKGQGPGGKAKQVVWNPSNARAKLGYKLFANALPPDDPFRRGLLQETPEKPWLALRLELDRLAKDPQSLSNDEVSLLCDHIALRSKASPDTKTEDCSEPKAGAAAQAIFASRDKVISSHLNTRLSRFQKMQIFVYGHTHALEFDWEVSNLLGGRSVKIFNTGAFQRLIDNEQFQAKAKLLKISPAEALKKLDLERDLPACYSAVQGTYNSQGDPTLVVKNWYVDDNGKGGFVSACDSRCASISRSCQK